MKLKKVISLTLIATILTLTATSCSSKNSGTKDSKDSGGKSADTKSADYEKVKKETIKKMGIKDNSNPELLKHVDSVYSVTQECLDDKTYYEPLDGKIIFWEEHGSVADFYKFNMPVSIADLNNFILKNNKYLDKKDIGYALAAKCDLIDYTQEDIKPISDVKIPEKGKIKLNRENDLYYARNTKINSIKSVFRAKPWIRNFLPITANIEDCYMIGVRNNINGDNAPVIFPKNITLDSTVEQVQKAYGKPIKVEDSKGSIEGKDVENDIYDISVMVEKEKDKITYSYGKEYTYEFSDKDKTAIIKVETEKGETTEKISEINYIYGEKSYLKE